MAEWALAVRTAASSNLSVDLEDNKYYSVIQNVGADIP